MAKNPVDFNGRRYNTGTRIDSNTLNSRMVRQRQPYVSRTDATQVISLKVFSAETTSNFPLDIERQRTRAIPFFRIKHVIYFCTETQLRNALWPFLAYHHVQSRTSPRLGVPLMVYDIIDIIIMDRAQKKKHRSISSNKRQNY